jgi:hypothetical protein
MIPALFVRKTRIRSRGFRPRKRSLKAAASGPLRRRLHVELSRPPAFAQFPSEFSFTAWPWSVKSSRSTMRNVWLFGPSVGRQPGSRTIESWLPCIARWNVSATIRASGPQVAVARMFGPSPRAARRPKGRSSGYAATPTGRRGCGRMVQ